MYFICRYYWRIDYVEEVKKTQFNVRVEASKASVFKDAVKKRGQSVQFILEKAIDAYIAETKELESSGKL